MHFASEYVLTTRRASFTAEESDSDSSDEISVRSSGRGSPQFGDTVIKESANLNTRSISASPPPPPPPPSRPPPSRKPKEKAEKKREEGADVNMLAVKFDVLQSPAQMHTGDPIHCENTECRAVLSSFSKVVPSDPNDASSSLRKWECEFCGKSQEVHCADGEQPTTPDVTYLLESGPRSAPAAEAGATEGQVQTGGAAEAAPVDESLVVFCVDVSGSMDTSSGLGARSSRAKLLSRLDAAKGAVAKQIEQLEQGNPFVRVALVTFSNDIAVYGDCMQTVRRVRGHELTDREALSSAALKEQTPSAIRASRQHIATVVNSLCTEGSTALGPALLFSVHLAARVPGSRVILCTDGMANEGLGKLGHTGFEGESLDHGMPFYRQLGTIAKNKSVTVNIVSFKGTDCRLIELGEVAAATGGAVSIVESEDLSEQMRALLAERLVATQVVATLLAHRALCWREDVEIEDAPEGQAVPPPPPPPPTPPGSSGSSSPQTKKAAQGQSNSSSQSATPKPLTTIIEASTTELTISQNQDQSQNQTQTPAPEVSIATSGEAPSPEAATVPKQNEKNEVRKETHKHMLPSRLVKTIGNVTSATTVTFRFHKQPGAHIDSQTKLTFQAQIKYRDVLGHVALRVLTSVREQTADAARAKAGMNMGVIGTWVSQTTAEYVSKGKFSKASRNVNVYKSLASERKDQLSMQVAEDLERLQCANLALQSQFKMNKSYASPDPLMHVASSSSAWSSSTRQMNQTSSKKKSAGGIGGFFSKIFGGNKDKAPQPNSDSEDDQVSNLSPPRSMGIFRETLQSRLQRSSAPQASRAMSNGTSEGGAASAAAVAEADVDASGTEDLKLARQTITDTQASLLYKHKNSSYI